MSVWASLHKARRRLNGNKPNDGCNIAGSVHSKSCCMHMIDLRMVC